MKSDKKVTRVLIFKFPYNGIVNSSKTTVCWVKSEFKRNLTSIQMDVLRQGYEKE